MKKETVEKKPQPTKDEEIFKSYFQKRLLG